MEENATTRTPPETESRFSSVLWDGIEKKVRELTRAAGFEGYVPEFAELLADYAGLAVDAAIGSSFDPEHSLTDRALVDDHAAARHDIGRSEELAAARGEERRDAHRALARVPAGGLTLARRIAYVLAIVFIAVVTVLAGQQLLAVAFGPLLQDFATYVVGPQSAARHAHALSFNLAVLVSIAVFSIYALAVLLTDGDVRPRLRVAYVIVVDLGLCVAVGVLRAHLTDNLVVIVGWSLTECSVALAHGLGLLMLADKLAREHERAAAHLLARQEAGRADEALASAQHELERARARAEALASRIAGREELHRQRETIIRSARTAALATYVTGVSELIAERSDELDPPLAAVLQDYLGSAVEPPTGKDGSHVA